MSIQLKAVFWVLAFFFFILFLFLLKGILLPFVASLVLAYFLDPVVEWLERKGLSRSIATSVLIIGFIVLVVIGLFFLIPIIQSQVSSFVEKVPEYATRIWNKVHPLLEQIKTLIPQAQVETMSQSLGESASSAVKFIAKILGGLLSSSMAFFNLASLIVITPVVCFYVLRDWGYIIRFIDSVIPIYCRDTFKEQLKEINVILSGFIRGQATVCLCLSIYYSIGLTLSGIDIGIVVGTATGILSFIPYVGCLSGFIVSLGLGLAQFSDYWHLLSIVGVFIIGQVLEGYVLTPRLVGEKVGLHPVWVIFALLAGGYLLGFLGILVAVPVAAVIGVLVRFGLKQYRDSVFYEGEVEKRG